MTAALSDVITVLAKGTFEEQATEVASFLSRSLPEAEREDYIAPLQVAAAEAGDDTEKQRAFVTKIVGNVKGAGEGTDREIEGVFNLLTALVFEVCPSPEKDAERSDLLEKLCKAIAVEGSPEKSIVKYRLLSNIFNALPSTSTSRLTVFYHLLDLASANDELDMLSDAFNSVPQWLATWDVPAAEKSACLSRIADKLEAADKGSQAFTFHVTYLRFLPADDANVQQAAEKAITAAFKLPAVYEFEQLYQLPAVQVLKGKPIFALLNIFVSGGLSQYREWQSANESEIQRLGLSADALERKIRLLDLASLCAQSESAEIPYSDIAATLQVPVDDVEIWVIDVIRVGLVSGKLSQVSQLFRVYRSTHRMFGPEQWKTLEARLVQWQSSISNILDVIASSNTNTISAPETSQEA